MPGRKFSANSSYRYGFNGKELDSDPIQYDYGFRIYDPRLGRFKSVDPLTKKYPMLTPYQFAGNKPINSIDLDGLEDISVFDHRDRTASIIITKIVVINKDVVSDISNAKSDIVHNLNAKGNETIYLENIPEYNKDNGSSIAAVEITQADFMKGKGFKVDVSYEVSLQTMNNKDFNSFKSANKFDTKYSFLEDNSSINFTEDAAAFNASTESGAGRITPNKEFWNNFSLNNQTPTVEELITHETGYHNMMGQGHQIDPNGKAIYPKTPTLESNKRGNIYPTHSNTMDIINKGVERGTTHRNDIYETLMNNRTRVIDTKTNTID